MQLLIACLHFKFVANFVLTSFCILTFNLLIGSKLVGKGYFRFFVVYYFNLVFVAPMLRGKEFCLKLSFVLNLIAVVLHYCPAYGCV